MSVAAADTGLQAMLSKDTSQGDERPTERPMLTVKLVRSAHGRLRRHRACVAGLGLRRIGHVVQVEDTPAVRGMIAKVGYLLDVRPATEPGGA